MLSATRATIMIKYTVVEDPRQRSIDYRDGQPLSVGYEFFDKRAYENAKIWLARHNVNFQDLGFADGGAVSEKKEFQPHVIVTAYTKKDSQFVFEHIEEVEECRLCVIASRMVDVVEQ